MACVTLTDARRGEAAVVGAADVGRGAPDMAEGGDIRQGEGLHAELRNREDRGGIGGLTHLRAGRGGGDFGRRADGLGLNMALVAPADMRRGHGGMRRVPVIRCRVPVVAESGDIRQGDCLRREGRVFKDGGGIGGLAHFRAGGREDDLRRHIHGLSLDMGVVVGADARRRQLRVVVVPFIGRRAPVVSQRRDRRVGGIIAVFAGVVGSPAVGVAGRGLPVMVHQIVDQAVARAAPLLVLVTPEGGTPGILSLCRLDHGGVAVGDDQHVVVHVIVDRIGTILDVVRDVERDVIAAGDELVGQLRQLVARLDHDLAQAVAVLQEAGSNGLYRGGDDDLVDAVGVAEPRAFNDVDKARDGHGAAAAGVRCQPQIPVALVGPELEVGIALVIEIVVAFGAHRGVRR